jgi:hypothetical protein
VCGVIDLMYRRICRTVARQLLAALPPVAKDLLVGDDTPCSPMSANALFESFPPQTFA